MSAHNQSTPSAALHAERALLPSGWAREVAVTIAPDGRIASVQSDAPRDPRALAVPVLLPAISNLHSHSFQRAMAGLSEARSPAGRESFWTWREIMYRFLDLLSPEDIEAIAAFAFMEMLEAGFPAVAEFHYLHNRPGGARYDDPAELSARIVAAAAGTGIGLTLLPVHYAQGGVDGRPLAGGQLRFANTLDNFLDLAAKAEGLLRSLPADARFGIAPHSLRAVAPADLARLAVLAPNRPLHMHIAEQEKEIEETLAVLGHRPVEWLLDNHAVDERWCLIHCTHMTPDETLRLAATGAVAGLCPITEANLGDGIFDGARHLDGAGKIGVGTDSNIQISLAGELRQLEYSQRLRDHARVVLAEPGRSVGRRLWEAALAGGGRALDRDAGAIAEGRYADLVAIDPPSGGFFGLEGDRLLDSFVFAGDSRMVSDVWSAGRRVVSGGRHRDHERIEAGYARSLASIMARL